MSVFHQNILAGASGAAGGAGEATYVDDVFSTFLYDGNGSTQTITNGIDLDGEGGLVWIKARDDTGFGHQLYDTERGTASNLSSHTNAAAGSTSSRVTAFNSNGFDLGANGTTNDSSKTYCSWTFRKAPGFFDVVTYTGTGSARTIAHNLGSTPGMIFIKGTSQDYDWKVWHRSLGASKYVVLNSNSTVVTGDTVHWNNTEPTSTHFSLGTGVGVNASGESFVAYIFAHDDQSFGTGSDEAIIKCGSYTGGYPNSVDVNLGFEPQWLLVKRYTQAGNWALYDNMRGVPTGRATNYLDANESSAEGTYSSGLIDFTANGFTARGGNSRSNYNNGDDFIYVAIRRPHKPPEAATDVFKANVETEVRSTSGWTSLSGFVTDAFINSRNLSAAKYTRFSSRLSGGRFMYTNATTTEGTDLYYGFDTNDGIREGDNSLRTVSDKHIDYHFRRAPGFFDVVAYTGTGSATTINHNLGAVPSVVLIKGRDTTFQWYWQHYALGANTWLQLNKDEDQASNGSLFNSTLPTSSVFSVSNLGGVNGSGNEYIAYLFGDLDGISKAGTYTGTGSNVDVDCGFTAGARFVIIKRADSSGDWYAWDSTRGIVSGDDPYIVMNTTDAEVTNTDYLDPLNSGFTVTSSAPADLNASGGTYIFLAIA